MNITAFCIKNTQFTLVCLVVIVVVGGYAILVMPKSEDPQFQSPKSLITVVCPGISTADMEQQVARPVEKKLAALRDVDRITSRIEEGLLITQINFQFGSDPDRKLDKVTTVMTETRQGLPQNCQSVAIDKFSTFDINILLYSLSSIQSDFHQFNKVTDRIERLVSSIDGVQSVTTELLPEQQLAIRVNPVKLKSLGLSFDHLINRVKQYTGKASQSYTLIGERQLSITGHRIPDIESVRSIPIMHTGNSIIHLGDIAHVEIDHAPPLFSAYVNGQKVVLIGITQQETANIVEVTERVRKMMAGIQQTLPEGMALNLLHEQALSVIDRLMGFFMNLLMGFLLVGFIAYWFLGLGIAAIIMLSVPLSILIAIYGTYIGGYGLQQMSIVGLMVALGMLVDNAIVVSENIIRLYREGNSPVQAAITGSKEVKWSILGGTLTTILAFFPLLFLQTESGLFLRSMPVAVILSLLASLLLALTLIPLLITKYLGYSPQAASKKSLLFNGIQRFSQRYYTPFLTKALAHKTVVFLIALALLLLTSLLAFRLEVSMFPAAEKNMLLIDIDVADGAGFHATQDIAHRAERIISDESAVETVISTIGKGFPRIYYNVFSSRQKSNYGQLLVIVKPPYQDQLATIAGKLYDRLSQLPGTRIKVREFIQGPPYDAPVAIRILGETSAAIQAQSEHIEALMASIEGIRMIENPLSTPQIELVTDIDRDKAARAGITAATLITLIDASLLGVKIGDYYDSDGDRYPVVINSRLNQSPDWSDIDAIKVRSADGKLLPISEFVRISMRNSFPILFRHEQQKMNLITAQVKHGAVVSRINAELQDKLGKLDWHDTHYQIAGEMEQLEETFSGMNKAMFFATLSIFVLLIFQFSSFSQPIIILLTIPFAAIGSVLTLWLLGYTFSFSAFVGLTALTGIVVNNAIIFIDYANHLIKAGLHKRKAIIQSCCTRLMPVLMTTATTILGLLPLSLSGSPMWGPMASSIIGGLLAATLVSMILVPVLYDMLSFKKW